MSNPCDDVAERAGLSDEEKAMISELVEEQKPLKSINEKIRDNKEKANASSLAVNAGKEDKTKLKQLQKERKNLQAQKKEIIKALELDMTNTIANRIADEQLSSGVGFVTNQRLQTKNGCISIHNALLPSGKVDGTYRAYISLLLKDTDDLQKAAAEAVKENDEDKIIHLTKEFNRKVTENENEIRKKLGEPLLDADLKRISFDDLQLRRKILPAKAIFNDFKRAVGKGSFKHLKEQGAEEVAIHLHSLFDEHWLADEEEAERARFTTMDGTASEMGWTAGDTLSFLKRQTYRYAVTNSSGWMERTTAMKFASAEAEKEFIKTYSAGALPSIRSATLGVASYLSQVAHFGRRLNRFDLAKMEGHLSTSNINALRDRLRVMNAVKPRADITFLRWGDWLSAYPVFRMALMAPKYFVSSFTDNANAKAMVSAGYHDFKAVMEGAGIGALNSVKEAFTEGPFNLLSKEYRDAIDQFNGDLLSIFHQYDRYAFAKQTTGNRLTKGWTNFWHEAQTMRDQRLRMMGNTLTAVRVRRWPSFKEMEKNDPFMYGWLKERNVKEEDWKFLKDHLDRQQASDSVFKGINPADFKESRHQQLAGMLADWGEEGSFPTRIAPNNLLTWMVDRNMHPISATLFGGTIGYFMRVLTKMWERSGEVARILDQNRALSFSSMMLVHAASSMGGTFAYRTALLLSGQITVDQYTDPVETAEDMGYLISRPIQLVHSLYSRDDSFEASAGASYAAIVKDITDIHDPNERKVVNDALHTLFSSWTTSVTNYQKGNTIYN